MKAVTTQPASLTSPAEIHSSPDAVEHVSLFAPMALAAALEKTASNVYGTPSSKLRARLLSLHRRVEDLSAEAASIADSLWRDEAREVQGMSEADAWEGDITVALGAG